MGGAGQPLELVLPDQSRVALVEPLEIGRGAASTLQLADPTVSRRHARIHVEADGCWP